MPWRNLSAVSALNYQNSSDQFPLEAFDYPYVANHSSLSTPESPFPSNSYETQDRHFSTSTYWLSTLDLRYWYLIRSYPFELNQFVALVKGSLISISQEQRDRLGTRSEVGLVAHSLWWQLWVIVGERTPGCGSLLPTGSGYLSWWRS